MTSAEAKKAMLAGRPVVYDGMQFPYISAMIYRRGVRNAVIAQVELLDRTKNSVVIVNPEKVMLKEEDV